MERLKAYFLLVIVTVFTFSQFAIVINFLANQEFIAQNLCENIEKPELECHGKCYLTKKLKEDEKQKGNDTIVQGEVILFVDSKSIEIVSEHFFITEREKSYFNLLEKRVIGFSSDIFHPPILAV